MDLLTPVNAAAVLYAGVGIAHFAVVVHDAVREPRFLKPADKPLLNRMKKTKASVAPLGRSYWQALIGAHLGHLLGLVLFVFLIELAQSPLMAWLRIPLIAIGIIYALIAWRCWFTLPAAGMALATALLAYGWLAS